MTKVYLKTGEEVLFHNKIDEENYIIERLQTELKSIK